MAHFPWWVLSIKTPCSEWIVPAALFSPWWERDQGSCLPQAYSSTSWSQRGCRRTGRHVSVYTRAIIHCYEVFFFLDKLIWFWLRPFLGVPLVSLESAERPNYFLVVSGRSRLQLEQWSRGVEFSRRATFIQHQGLFLPGHTSFELVVQPGVFLTLTRTAARAQRYDTSEGFKASSSFTLEGQKLKHTMAPKPYNLITFI